MSEMSSTEMNTDGSDSNSSSNFYWPKIRPRMENPTSSVRFKGVVLQQNGHWGAQIYANHQRIWLGTFKSEKEAAMAYDSAAIKLRSGDSHRNFQWTNVTIQEPGFQDQYSTEAVLDMIKDGSYESKFTDYLRSQSTKATIEGLLDSATRSFINQEGILCQQLFQKELTPSDVGKLNRLVIPKKHALRYFPVLPEASEEREENNNGEHGSSEEEEVELVFFDNKMRPWKFRYCYWKSSQSFVFTRGWNRFVKDKDLKAKDTITFYKCEYKERANTNERKSFSTIEVAYNEGGENVVNKKNNVENRGNLEVQLCLGRNYGTGSDGEGKGGDDDKEEWADIQVKKKIRLTRKEESCGNVRNEGNGGSVELQLCLGWQFGCGSNEEEEKELAHTKAKKKFKLFGADIN